MYVKYKGKLLGNTLKRVIERRIGELKMKRFLIILLAAVLVFSSGCGASGGETEDPGSDKEAPKGNYIHSLELTEEEKSLVELVSADIQTYEIFDYHFDESYSGIVFKMDVYREGNLVQTSTIMNTDFYENVRDGRIAVLLNDTDIWVNIESDGGYESSHRSCPDLLMEKNGGKVLEFSGGEVDDKGRVVLCTVGLYQQEPEGGVMQKESVPENIDRYERFILIYAELN